MSVDQEAFRNLRPAAILELTIQLSTGDNIRKFRVEALAKRFDDLVIG